MSFAIVSPEPSIRTLDDWKLHAPPAKGKEHWRDQRSAKELAKSWVSGGVPQDVRSVLEQCPASASFTGVLAMPEAPVRLDAYAGNCRKTDLLVYGYAGGRGLVLSVEGKADEPFGPTVAEQQAYAKTKLAKAPKSHALDRLVELTQAVLGDQPDEVPGIRYQLIHAVAGSLIAAKHAGTAVFLVHEFRSSATDPKKHQANCEDLNAFIALLNPPGAPIPETGGIVGPFRVPGNQCVPNCVDLYIAKAVTQLV
ncbi:MAG TPA: hypothetical protein VGN26_18775 [Armatimonadota bacterium]|jgi:hypothetical protein